MSWGFQAQAKDAGEVGEKLETAQQASLDQTPFDSWDDDVAEQQAAAFAAAEQISASGVVGKGPFSISLSGHCSRGETDMPSLYINIVQQPPPPKPPKK